MARLLTPEDFGLVAMVTAVTGFLEMYQDAGLSAATVQRPRINHEQVSALFWLNVALGCLFTVVVSCLAPAMGWLYGEPRVTWITLTLACGFIFMGSSVQHSALLQRQMRFGSIGTIAIASQVVGLIGGITTAILGGDYWALIVTSLLTTATSTVLIWRTSQWRPGPPRRGTGIRPMLSFSGYLTVAGFCSYVQRTADNFLLGWVWGPAPLGLYTKAYQILLLPISQIKGPISAVAIPTLSRLLDDPDRYRRYFCKAMTCITSTAVPCVIFCFVSVHSIVLVVLGQHWASVVPVFQALAPAALINTIAVGWGWVLITSGRTDRLSKINLAVTAVFLLAFSIAVSNGVLAVAWACSLAFAVTYPVAIVYALHKTPVHPIDLIRVSWRPITAAALAGLADFLLQHLEVFQAGSLAGLLAEGLLFASLYVAIFWVLPGGHDCISDMLGMFRQLRPSHKNDIPVTTNCPALAGESGQPN
ncbi:MAG: lipopolysaccharide biosynthesis protein [Bryobacteraceae bacterium]|nr:lipopolysaccharide biosynthesis protein [Bryobacteraceae bacterium]